MMVKTHAQEFLADNKNIKQNELMEHLYDQYEVTIDRLSLKHQQHYSYMELDTTFKDNSSMLLTINMSGIDGSYIRHFVKET